MVGTEFAARWKDSLRFKFGYSNHQCLSVLSIASVAMGVAITVAIALAQPLEVEWHYKSGGLPQVVRFGGIEAPTIAGVRIYTDWGILHPGRYDAVGSHNENEPKVHKRFERARDGRREITVVEAIGQLKNAHGQPCGLSYRLVHSVDGNVLSLDASVCAEKNFEAMHGFLAIVFPFKGATEWFALTEAGWLFCDISKDGRVFQAAQTPVSDKGLVGIANSRIGYCIVIKLIECTPKDSLDNVIIHTNADGSGGIFFAWCDGMALRAMRSGESWRIRLQLQFVPFAGFEWVINEHSGEGIVRPLQRGGYHARQFAARLHDD